MTKPSVSIITPSYNQAEYIEDTLKSVKIQEYKNIEHIVIDGGSTDNTTQILKKYQNQYNLKWISEPDKGQADAINKGFSLAEGDILGWLNSDDVYLSKSTVSTAVNVLIEYPQADIVNGRGIRLKEDGSWDHPIKRRDHKLSHSGLKQIASVLQPATFWYRYVWKEIGINSELEYTFDWDFFIRSTENYNLIPIPDYIIGYRWQGENKTTTGGLPRAREIRDVTGEYLGRSSWQYQLLCIYCGIYNISEMMPNPIQNRIESVLTFFSNVVSYLTLKQISGI
jgi:glycosyltransferase involved in cell wall biosynthesis